jgi:adenosylhomocysteine nucleosidase
MKNEVDKQAASAGGVLVCFALEEEKVAFQKIAERNASVSILVTGIGQKNAEKSLRDFLANKIPARVLTCGFAGALVSDLAIGAVVFETDDAQLRKALTAAGARAVKFHCADRIATTSGEKRELRQGTNADAVEMESGVINGICRERGLPCATVRVISDVVDEDLPLDFNLLSKPDRSMDYGKLAWAVAKSPGKIGALRRLQKQTRFAAEQLAAVLAKVISP